MPKHSKRILNPLICLILLLVSLPQAIAANNLRLIEISSKNSFPLVSSNNAADIFIDPVDAEVVSIAAKALQSDIQLVTGITPKLQKRAGNISSNAVIIGTLGKSALIDQLSRNKKLSLKSIQGKWETFVIAVVANPLKNVKQALIIAGSDRRGTAFGVFELSRLIGVSPWYWWADATPMHRDSLYIAGSRLEGPPSVKYRGIFLNDEDWGLKPWASCKMDPDIKDIGPNTYARVFELLLRLKANYIWPAMHECTAAFYTYPDSPKTADRYAIMVGSSHCEPMLRDNPWEWRFFEREYGEKPGEWRYDTNKDRIYKYWEDRVKQSANYDSIYTVGMRGVHDSGMPGPKSKPEKIKLLEQIFEDQRGLLSKYIAKPISEIPQIFCPYKEVLELYQSGLKVPDDVTIVWPDDNHGYVRQLSTPDEEKRLGGSGVYYHISYWGAPLDYLWLCSTSPSLTSYELKKAYEYGASRLWVINVGDIKPAEMETEFAMDMAWNIDKWSPENAYQYPEKWAAETFGKEYAPAIANIKREYYRLSQCGKPEHLGQLLFDDATEDERMRDYQAISTQAEELMNTLPDRLKDVYFETIYYPVMGARLLNEKVFYARRSFYAATDSEKTIAAEKAQRAYDKIQSLTKVYNEEIAGGKWNGMMSSHPRDIEVYFMPKSADKAKGWINGSSASEKPTAQGYAVAAADYINKKESNSITIQTFLGLGLGGRSISLQPFKAPSIPDNKVTDAPYVEYKAELAAGDRAVVVKCLPTRSICMGCGLRYAVSINGSAPQIVNADIPKEDKTWSYSVMRGYSIGESKHKVDNSGPVIIRIYLLDPGLVLSRVEIL